MFKLLLIKNLVTIKRFLKNKINLFIFLIYETNKITLIFVCNSAKSCLNNY